MPLVLQKSVIVMYRKFRNVTVSIFKKNLKISPISEVLGVGRYGLISQQGIVHTNLSTCYDSVKIYSIHIQA